MVRHIEKAGRWAVWSSAAVLAANLVSGCTSEVSGEARPEQGPLQTSSSIARNIANTAICIALNERSGTKSGVGQPWVRTVAPEAIVSNRTSVRGEDDFLDWPQPAEHRVEVEISRVPYVLKHDEKGSGWAQLQLSWQEKNDLGTFHTLYVAVPADPGSKEIWGTDRLGSEGVNAIRKTMTPEKAGRFILATADKGKGFYVLAEYNRQDGRVAVGGYDENYKPISSNDPVLFADMARRSLAAISGSFKEYSGVDC